MGFKVTPFPDMPIENATLLGHDKVIKNLITFLESGSIVTPLTIAVHGDWGSGKTSIMNTLLGKLSERRFDTIFFEAWKYEYSNPSLGLVSSIAVKYSDDSKKIKLIVTTAATILANKFLNTDITQLVDIVTNREQTKKTLTDELYEIIEKKLDKKKLIIIIDDLDRCDVENSLQLLSLIKLFLSIPNCICIAAVDFNRLRQAWLQKYHVTDNNLNETGQEYLDKIFQVRIGIPKPSTLQVEKYLRPLVPGMPKILLELFAKIGPKNPRAIKKILNLISYRSTLLYSKFDAESATLWTILEEIVGNEMLIRICDVLKKEKHSLGEAVYSMSEDWSSLKNFLTNHIPAKDLLPKMEKLKIYFEDGNRFIKSSKFRTRFSVNKLERDFEALYLATNEVLK